MPARSIATRRTGWRNAIHCRFDLGQLVANLGAVAVGKDDFVPRLDHADDGAETLPCIIELLLDGAAGAFLDDGVFQLVKGQKTDGVEMKNFSPTYRALEGYDIEKLYVEKESLEARGLTEDDLLVDVTVLSSKEMGALMDEQDVVLSF